MLWVMVAAIAIAWYLLTDHQGTIPIDFGSEPQSHTRMIYTMNMEAPLFLEPVGKLTWWDDGTWLLQRIPGRTTDDE
jgi:hypothetical protein